MVENEPQGDPERTVCFCNFVSHAALVKAIREGNRTLEQIQAVTRASTGCGGCEGEVVEILKEENEKENARAAASPAKA